MPFFQDKKLQHKDTDIPAVKRLAQIGLISKGLIYSAFGTLILMATYGASNQPVKIFAIIKYVMTFGWYGRGLVFLLAIGILCYSAWKFMQMAYNTEDYDDSLRGYFVRVSWVGPFLFYLFLGGHAAITLYQFYFGDFSYSAEGGGLADLLNKDWGRWVIAFVCVSFLVNGSTLFYLAFTGNYTIMLTGRGSTDSPKLARWTGFMGYFFFGLALFIIGVLFAVALFQKKESLAEGSESMFTYLMGESYGKILLTFIALGTVCYGIYFFLAAHYRWAGDDGPSSKGSASSE